MDRNPIQSPTELDEGGWRGRVRGVTRISAKAGFTAAVVLAALFGMIVYGISTAGRRHASNAGSVTLTKASEHHAPWWSTEPNAQPTPVRIPSPIPLPTRIQLPTIPSSVHVPAIGKISATQLEGLEAARERQQREQALGEAAAAAPALVRMNQSGAPALATPQPSPSVPAIGAGSERLLDNQIERFAFLASANAPHDRFLAVRQDDLSPYVLHAGSVIPATLLTGINADLPGTIVGQVRDDVFDSVVGRYLLIPRGTRLVGTYDSRIVQGQRRVLVAWIRLLYPDGSSLDLPGMAGTDPAGYAGFGANVDEHLNKIFTSALLLSIIGAGAQLSQPQQLGSIYAPPSIGQTIAGAVGQQIGNTSIQLTQRELQVPPTLEVPPGYLFDVLVDRDIVLVAPYGGLGAR
jgi:type IV secretion system protein VirB10